MIRKKTSKVFMLLIQLDHSSEIPIFRQIIAEIKQLIDSTTFHSGDRLPSSRELAETLGVNRSTVYRAYQELWAQGYIDCKPGTYTTVRIRKASHRQDSGRIISKIDWEKASSEPGKKIFKRSLQKTCPATISDLTNFVSLSPDPRLNPVEEFRKCQNHVMRTIGAPLLQYSDSMGYTPLREYISKRLRTHGIRLDVEEIIITNGVQQALNLLIQLLVKPGSCIAVEMPTYSSLLSLVDLYDAKVVGIPMTNNGMDLTQLARVIPEQKPAVLYTMPNFHNPMGITTSHAHREKLIAMCEKENILIIEDGFEEELKYFGKAVLPLKAMDHKGCVIYLGTFSKVLFPGLRIGWIAAAKDCIQRINALKQVNDISGNIMEQAALNHFCRTGTYELHVKRMHREYRKRMKTALAAAKLYIPTPDFSYTIPTGGYTLWVTAKDPHLSEKQLVEKARAVGVNISPGSRYFPHPVAQTCFKVSIAHCNEVEIETGFQRLGIALSSFKKQ